MGGESGWVGHIGEIAEESEALRVEGEACQAFEEQGRRNSFGKAA